MDLNEFLNAYAFLIKQQLQALAHLENCGVVFGNIKPSRFLFDINTNNLKLINFEQAVKRLDRAPVIHEEQAAPEAFKLLFNDQAFLPATEALDIYALGQQFYRVLSRLETGQDTFFSHQTHIPKGTDRQERLSILSQAMEDYIKPNADNSYKQAFPDNEASRHRFFRAIAKRCHPQMSDQEQLDAETQKVQQQLTPALELVNQLLHPNPDLRIKASKALESPFFKDKPINEKQALNTINQTTSDI